MLDGPANKVGHHHADQDEYNVKRQQSHSEGPNQIPVRAGSGP
jgi:hypothetical protein